MRTRWPASRPRLRRTAWSEQLPSPVKMSRVSMKRTHGAAAPQATLPTTQRDASVRHYHGGSECPNSTLSSAVIRDYSTRFLVEGWKCGGVWGRGRESNGDLGAGNFSKKSPHPLPEQEATWGLCVNA